MSACVRPLLNLTRPPSGSGTAVCGVGFWQVRRLAPCRQVWGGGTTTLCLDSAGTGGSLTSTYIQLGKGTPGKTLQLGKMLGLLRRQLGSRRISHQSETLQSTYAGLWQDSVLRL